MKRLIYCTLGHSGRAVNFRLSKTPYVRRRQSPRPGPAVDRRCRAHVRGAVPAVTARAFAVFPPACRVRQPWASHAKRSRLGFANRWEY